MVKFVLINFWFLKIFFDHIFQQYSFISSFVFVYVCVMDVKCNQVYKHEVCVYFYLICD